MSTLRFFDANSMVGRWATYTQGSFYSVRGLLEEMDRCNIREVLVFHSLARDYNPTFGNEKLLKEIKGYERLHPCWVTVPHQTKEMPEPSNLVREMLKNGVKALRLFPRKHLFPGLALHEYSINKCILEEFFTMVEVHRIPLLLDFGRSHWSDKVYECSEIAEICSSYPHLPVILIREAWGQNRSLYALLEKFNNLYVEISYYFGHMGIEDICENFGAKHLIYGTGMPVFPPGPPTMMVTYADISDKDRELIAEENLRKLLKEVK